MISTKPRRDVHIVGSVPLKNSEEVIGAIANTLGERVQRIPDGETGERLKWIEWQSAIFDEHPMFARIQEGPGSQFDWRNEEVGKEWKLAGWFVLRPGVSGRDVVFGPLGYASAARASYAVFARLKEQGVIPSSCRFQVSIPTPYNIMDQRIAPAQRLDVEAAYEKRMMAEIDEISMNIPHGELAIQWDAAHEIQNLAGGRPHWFANPESGILERLVRLASRIPDDVELGYHFCYGDFAHKHFIEPADTGLMVRLANALAEACTRPIRWFHMPVPRNRADDAYFAPLSDLRLKAETRLYLGLVHFTDGIPGALQRIETAKKIIGDFGISTECGWGRRDPATIPEVLRIHAEICERGV